MSLQDELKSRYQIDILAGEAGGYFSVPTKEGMEYTDLFLSICRQFGIRYNKATPKERAFVEEVTRVTWAVEQGETVGKNVRPAFSA